MSSSPRSSPVALRSNLQSFINSVAPTVPARLVNKRRIDATTQLHTETGETVETFTLGDLWEVYDKWSAHGHGVPVMLKDGIAVQCYVPSLSGIQIFTHKKAHLRRISGPGEQVNEVWSVGSESDDLSRTSSNSSNVWDDISSDSSNDQGAPRASNEHLRSHLYFEYFEKSSPCTRVPIMNKILEFAPTFPGLCTLRSVDLAPGSWISIAWCPIHPIPVQEHVRDLSACFLAFHTLSASFQDEDLVLHRDRDGNSFLSVRPFGLATYRLERRFWLNGVNDCIKAFQLYDAADCWLKQLEVKQHHDFNIFASCSPLKEWVPYP